MNAKTLLSAVAHSAVRKQILAGHRYCSAARPADKGAHLAIDAARGAGRRILLAGKLTEPHEQAYFDSEVAPRLGDDAEFIGEADTSAKQELYGAAHCVCGRDRGLPHATFSHKKGQFRHTPIVSS